MSSAFNSAVSLFNDLKTEWAKQTPNLKKCGQLLDQLKVNLDENCFVTRRQFSGYFSPVLRPVQIALIELSFLPTGQSVSKKEELILGRDVLEIGVEWSVANKNIPSFERYMSQLKCYYYDYKNQIGESKNKYQLLGLNLLFLLSQNRVAEFHTELELLPANIIQTNQFVRHPLALEQYLMEGRYNKIFMAKGEAPANSYKFFIDILLDTVRNEIGVCLERAYEKISLQAASKRLYLKNNEEVKKFGTKVIKYITF
jgi:26S proteasome regulatory subunit N12